MKINYSSYRTEVSANQGHLHRNRSTSWKMQWNHSLFIHKIIDAGIFCTQSFCQHFWLFFDRFGKRCVWITFSYGVKCFPFYVDTPKYNWKSKYFRLSIDRFPFNPKTPIGYIVASIVEYFVFWHNFYLALCLVSFGIGSFLFAVTLAKFLENTLYHINIKAKKKKTQSTAWHELIDFIELQMDGKQLSLLWICIFSKILICPFMVYVLGLWKFSPIFMNKYF